MPLDRWDDIDNFIDQHRSSIRAPMQQDLDADQRILRDDFDTPTTVHRDDGDRDPGVVRRPREIGRIPERGPGATEQRPDDRDDLSIGLPLRDLDAVRRAPKRRDFLASSGPTFFASPFISAALHQVVGVDRWVGTALPKAAVPPGPVVARPPVPTLPRVRTRVANPTRVRAEQDEPSNSLRRRGAPLRVRCSDVLGAGKRSWILYSQEPNGQRSFHHRSSNPFNSVRACLRPRTDDLGQMSTAKM
jgi:hypothetical protein